MIELPFSRKMETEADEFGLKLASKACFDIRHAPLYWAKMDGMEQESEKEGENIQIPEFLSTHPSHENRGKNLANLLPKFLDFRTSCGCEKLPQCDITQQMLKELFDLSTKYRTEPVHNELTREKNSNSKCVFGWLYNYLKD